MATHLALDPDSLDRVVAVSGEPTKKAAVALALKEFVARREQRRVSELFGKLDWDASYDNKAQRSRSWPCLSTPVFGLLRSGATDQLSPEKLSRCARRWTALTRS